MSVNQMRELGNLQEDQKDPRETEGLSEAQLFGVEDEVAISSSSPSVLFSDRPEEVAAAVAPSPLHSLQGACAVPLAVAAPPCSRSPSEGSSSQNEGESSSSESLGAETLLQYALSFKMIDLVGFLLLKYRAKEPTTKVEMVNNVIREHEGHFPEILSQALLCLQLVFGVDVREVDARNHTYVLGPTLGLTCDDVSDQSSMPKTGLLILLLSTIAMEGDSAPEHKVWEVLSNIGVHDGIQHYIFGEPRELITEVWVQEKYVEYQQVPGSDPARYEFRWGPRAHAETTTWEVLQFIRLSTRNVSSPPFLFF